MAVPVAPITGKVLLPDGVGPQSGFLTYELMKDGQPTLGVVADGAINHKIGGKKRQTIANGGDVSFNIVPNDSITSPTGTTYRVQMELVDADGFSHFKEDTWTVTGVGAKDIGDL